MIMTSPLKAAQPRAEQALRRLLTLIRTSQSIDDFTPGRLEAVMERPVQRWSETYGFLERLTSQWTYVFVVRNEDRPQVEFSFRERPGSYPPMTDICQLNYDAFAGELEAMGYRRESHYDSPPQAPHGQPQLRHGGLLYERFHRPSSSPGLRIKVYPRGEGVADSPSRVCVKTVWVG